MTSNQKGLTPNMTPPQGILLVNKPKGRTSFSLIPPLRKRLGVSKIGHAGTLDPFATGLMVILIGKNYTRLSEQFLNHDKEYHGRIHLGITTDSYDCDGEITHQNDSIPTNEQIHSTLSCFQGWIDQTPPMFSAKKVGGKKLYELARKGQHIERQPSRVEVCIKLINYSYPYVDIHVRCSKGTYIRSLAYDIGLQLGCGAHLSQLERIRSGPFHIENALSSQYLADPDFDLTTAFAAV